MENQKTSKLRFISSCRMLVRLISTVYINAINITLLSILKSSTQITAIINTFETPTNKKMFNYRLSVKLYFLYNTTSCIT